MATTQKTYNGHKNFNHWNQALWINKDESLYNLARNYTTFKNRSYSKDDCAAAVLSELHSRGITHTPDGVKWSKSGIRAALVGM